MPQAPLAAITTLFPYTTLFRSRDKIRGRSKLPTRKSVVVFSPHPDDDVISMGGEKTTTELRSEEHTSELQSLTKVVCRLLIEKKNTTSLNSRFKSLDTLKVKII